MKLNILIFKNTVLGCYTTPQFDDHDVEIVAVQLARSIKANLTESKEDKVVHLKGLELYHLGTFDDETGLCDILEYPKLLLNCEEVFKTYGKKDKD